MQFSAPRSLTHRRLRLRFCGKQGQSCADSKSSVIVRCVLLMLFLLSIHFLLSVCFSLSGYKRMRVHSELWKDGFLCARVQERQKGLGAKGTVLNFSFTRGRNLGYGASCTACLFSTELVQGLVMGGGRYIPRVFG